MQETEILTDIGQPKDIGWVLCALLCNVSMSKNAYTLLQPSPWSTWEHVSLHSLLRSFLTLYSVHKYSSTMLTKSDVQSTTVSSQLLSRQQPACNSQRLLAALLHTVTAQRGSTKRAQDGSSTGKSGFRMSFFISFCTDFNESFAWVLLCEPHERRHACKSHCSMPALTFGTGVICWQAAQGGCISLQNSMAALISWD